MSEHWKFAEINHIEDYSFNKVLKNFYGFGISGLVRENIQNSLDGKLEGVNEPVKVKIELGSVRTEGIPHIDEVFKRIKSLVGKNDYTRETIRHMKKKIEGEMCNYITFEDLNTKGLSGADDCERGKKGSSFGAYAYNKGVHVVDENSQKEKLRGGSHGIGKIASNAASDLFVMFFANCDEYGNRHIGGNVQLIEHEYNGQGYRATGYFTRETANRYHPFENNYSGIFKKDKRGLKIIIPFLRDQFNNEDEIIRGICDSFFLAIIENKLIVEVNEKVIDKESIESYLKSEKYYKDQKLEETKTNFTPVYYDTYTKKEMRKIEVLDREKEKYEFSLFFNYDERLPKGRVGIIRTIGMKIEDMAVKGNATKPYNAVLVPSSSKEDAFLKSLENESHTKLSSKHFNSDKLQKNALRFINNLGKEIAKIITEEMMKNNPSDGEMNTGDIIYNTEIAFKEDLEKAAAVIKVGKGKKGNSKSIVQIENGKEKRKKREDKDEKKESKLTDKKRNGDNQRKTKKITKTNQDGEKKVFFKVEPSYVNRGFKGDTEIIKLDLSKNKDIKHAQKCELSLAVVDGMGVEHLDEFNIGENYSSIVDGNTGKSLEIEDNSVKNISMKDGVIRLRSSVSKGYNKTLKFVYHIREV